MCSSSPPPPPNYAAAAGAQGAANVQTAIAQSVLNRPNETTPYGSRTWNQSGTYTIPSAGANNPAIDMPTYSSSVNLTPLGQQRFDQEQRIMGSLGNTAEAGLNRVGDAMATPFSMQSANDVQDRAESAYMARLEPMLERQRAQTETRLVNQGLRAGGEAYNADMENMNRGQNDARMQAIIAGLQTRPQTIQEESAIRQMPLNELNALRTGSQVTVPQFAQTAPTSIAPPPIFGAAQAQGQYDMNSYNQEMASNNAFMSGLANIGGMMGYGMMR